MPVLICVPRSHAESQRHEGRHGCRILRLDALREYSDVPAVCPKLASRLADKGLILARLQPDQAFTEFADNLVAGRIDVKPNTRKLWWQTDLTTLCKLLLSQNLTPRFSFVDEP